MKKKYLIIGILSLFLTTGFSQDSIKKVELKDAATTKSTNTAKSADKPKQPNISTAESNVAENKKLDKNKTTPKPELLLMDKK